MPTFHRIPVRLKSCRYDLRIGSNHLTSLGSAVRSLRLGSHPVVLTNPTILRTHAPAVARLLSRSGFPVRTLTVPDTERSKSLPALSDLLSRLADLDRPGRRLFLVLVGGGVVGDLGGLAAGLYRRGIPYLQVPTTLLAQVDSSIGGKTGVDLPQGKNLVGLFNQPRLVFIELSFLRTLPDRQFRSGLAEVAKCGVIRDPEIFRFLERTSVADLRRDEKRLGWLVARAVRVKASVVEADERETRGIRTILNFGHTLGHALEAATGYGAAYTHGEAIAVGMAAATLISLRLRLIPASSAERLLRLIPHLGLPIGIRGPRPGISEILRAMSHDKKWQAGRNRWVLPTGIGRVLVRRDVPERIIRSVIEELRAGFKAGS
ncbi:MAG: 3-dehydroquinate synthase [Candidatus Omnitrophica bacterium]|nr:3-dehydroquinate synthase [Candidatus Omnitrophota bacterium]